MRILLALTAWVALATLGMTQEPAAKKAGDAGGKKAAETTDKKDAPSAAAAPATEPSLAGRQSFDRGPKPLYLEVDRQSKGPPVLVVRYPWQSAHSRPSIEVRVLADGEANDPTVRPLKFVELFLKGNLTAALHEARDRAWDLPTSSTFTERGRDLQIHGQRNRMGKPCSVVVFPGLSAPNPDKPQEDTVPRAVFCLLDSWAFDARTLRLDLPTPQFKKPCRLRVWFLRDGNVVWSETVGWPGLAGK